MKSALIKAVNLFRPPQPEIARLADRYRLTQWRSAAVQREEQSAKLRTLLEHCWHNVPYYRGVFERSGARAPGEVRLENLPPLTKAVLRGEFERLKSRDLSARRWKVNRSGGSTGEPVTLIQDHDYLVQSEAKKRVCFEWAGYRLGDRAVNLWGSERDTLHRRPGWRNAARAFMNNSRTLNAFKMTPDLMRHYLEIIDQERPQCVYAYAHAVFELAKFALQNGIRVRPPGSVISTSGNLYPFIRKTIEEAFQCPVFDQYGSREVSCVAAECERRAGLHVNMETMIVEVLDPSGRPCPPGVEGDIAVTSLANYSMPLIRYLIGDRGILSDKACPCGRGLALLSRVTGRSMDCFRKTDGTVVPGEYFIHFLGVVYNRGWLDKVQVVQKAFDRFTVLIVARKGAPSDAELDEVERTVKLTMGEECAVEIRMVDDIPLTESGKHRYTICELSDSVTRGNNHVR